MISVTVIALGKLKESYMRDFCAEYEKRLKAFCKINITELSPVRLSQNPSEGEIKKGSRQRGCAYKIQNTVRRLCIFDVH